MQAAPAIHHYLDPDAEGILRRLHAPRRALFLDRDGVVNRDHGYVHCMAQVEWIPGIFELCREAAEAGHALIVVTNQAGIARGLYDEAQFLEFTRALHARFTEERAPLLATYYCPHHPQAGSGRLTRECACRKPKPGMINHAVGAFGLERAGSMLLGDKRTDLLAAEAAGLGCAALYKGGKMPRFGSLGWLPPGGATMDGARSGGNGQRREDDHGC